jgi:hypothetical protein
VQEPLVANKQKKNEMEGSIWKDCHFGDGQPEEYPRGPKD